MVGVALQLLAQMAHVDIHGTIVAHLGMIAPHRFQNLIAGYRAVRAGDQIAQQPEFGGRQVDDLAGAEHLQQFQVEGHIVEHDLFVAAALRQFPVGAAQQGAHPRQQFAELVRLYHVVVRAQLEAEHLVHLFVARREHQNRLPKALLAKPAAQIEAVGIGQPNVENDQMRRLLGDQLVASAAILSPQHDVTFLLQGETEPLGYRRVIFDQGDTLFTGPKISASKGCLTHSGCPR